ncbi:MAG: hypothetical protein AAF411_03250 [Myxococcota bacterium]
MRWALWLLLLPWAGCVQGGEVFRLDEGAPDLAMSDATVDAFTPPTVLLAYSSSSDGSDVRSLENARIPGTTIYPFLQVPSDVVSVEVVLYDFADRAVEVGRCALGHSNGDGRATAHGPSRLSLGHGARSAHPSLCRWNGNGGAARL